MIVFDYQTVSSAVKDSNRFCIVLLGESWMMTTGYVLLRFRFLLLSSSSSSKVMTTHCCMPSREYCTLLLRTLSHPECSHFLSSSRTAVFFSVFAFSCRLVIRLLTPPSCSHVRDAHQLIDGVDYCRLNFCSF